ncbi:hypothetical protein CpE9_0735 [Corynebacterium pseudotuberculosis]|nr:Hypothetical protein Cp38MAT_0735 [Corynebacterium pseudotuberculosis]QCG72238.1 Hypothetical protein CpOVI1FL_0730 [Corynebacterium pseudotuberculosis]QDL49045.1 hypothetical protein CpOVICCA32_0736 [Corynebacterium pseudotuberculosis]QDL51120.1 hypothetical protein CpE9_0735 [Corynebacterium pseudotuberculosis]
MIKVAFTLPNAKKSMALGEEFCFWRARSLPFWWRCVSGML